MIRIQFFIPYWVHWTKLHTIQSIQVWRLPHDDCFVTYELRLK